MFSLTKRKISHQFLLLIFLSAECCQALPYIRGGQTTGSHMYIDSTYYECMQK